MNPLKTIEDTLLTRISAALPTQLKAIDSLPGPLNARLLAQLAPKAPGVFTTFVGAVPGRSLPEETVGSRWALYILTSHASGQAARRHGDAVAIGAYEVLAAIAPAMREAIPEFGRPKFMRADNLWSGELEKRGFALFAMTYEIPMPLPSLADANELGDFLVFHNDSDINGDAVIDQTTEVELEAP